MVIVVGCLTFVVCCVVVADCRCVVVNIVFDGYSCLVSIACWFLLLLSLSVNVARRCLLPLVVYVCCLLFVWVFPCRLLL